MSFRHIFGCLVAALLGMVLVASASAEPVTQKRVLLFTHTTGYRHASIEPGSKAIIAMGRQLHVTIVRSEDPDVFSSGGLRDYDGIIFLSTTTDPKKPDSEWFQGDRRTALQEFVHRGGGIV